MGKKVSGVQEPKPLIYKRVCCTASLVTSRHHLQRHSWHQVPCCMPHWEVTQGSGRKTCFLWVSWGNQEYLKTVPVTGSMLNKNNTKQPMTEGFPGGSVAKNSPASAGEVGSISDLGRPRGGGNSNPLQYSCLENPMGRGAWWTAVHGVTKELDTT